LAIHGQTVGQHCPKDCPNFSAALPVKLFKKRLDPDSALAEVPNHTFPKPKQKEGIMPQKPPEKPSGKTASQPAPEPPGRKPWKKKTPVDVVLQQGEKLRAEIADLDEELKRKREQLKKFDEIRKLLEEK
jgi:hypothetical protein